MSEFSLYVNALDKITKNIAQNAENFVVYKSPADNEIHLICGASTKKIVDISKLCDGFVFVPFQATTETSYIFSIEKIYAGNSLLQYAQNIQKQEGSFAFSDQIPQGVTSETHLANISKAIDEIQIGSYKKIVLARNYTALYKSDLVAAYIRLCELNPQAFCYWVYVHNEACWMGATPEVLLQCKDQKIETMSLAGTQLKQASGNYVWGIKEKEEQEIVTNYIKEILQKYASGSIEVSEPFTKETANLAHICTPFTAELAPDASLISLITSLHPTPAVCGIPTQKAQAFIDQYESNNRQFYSGFIGTISNNMRACSLYVNLRCASIYKEYASIYAGGGITATSIPEQEWAETENKMKMMKQVLHVT